MESFGGYSKAIPTVTEFPSCGMEFSLLLLFMDVRNPRTKLGAGLKSVD
jgi:hypothetical protein